VDLLLNVRRDDHGATVDVAGEIDHHSSTQLLDCALCAIREHGPRLAVDLADVTFMDCGGVDVLLAVRRRSHLLGGYLSVVSASAPVRRLLAILDMDAVLTAPESSEVDTHAMRSSHYGTASCPHRRAYRHHPRVPVS
jgi:anti-sigma B factor antagonist